MLLEFMIFTKYPPYPNPSPYTVYKMDSEAYFGEEDILSDKIEKERTNQESISENLSKEPLDHKIVKLKGVPSSENLIKVLEYEDFPLPLIDKYYTKKSSILIDET